MPYIRKESRKEIDKFLDGLIVLLINGTQSGKVNNGNIVYVIYKILKDIYGEGRFEQRSNALKVLEAAKLEFYRKVLVPYENLKEKENGPI